MYVGLESKGGVIQPLYEGFQLLVALVRSPYTGDHSILAILGPPVYGSLIYHISSRGP